MMTTDTIASTIIPSTAWFIYADLSVQIWKQFVILVAIFDDTCNDILTIDASIYTWIISIWHTKTKTFFELHNNVFIFVSLI